MKRNGTSNKIKNFMKNITVRGSKTSGTGSASGPGKSELPPPALLGNVLESAPLKPLLTPAELTERQELETAIKSGWKTFLEVGSAVAKIRDKKLYRDKYETFEQYLLTELGYSLPYAYSLIGSAEVNAQMSAIAEITVKPLNEAQFRELIPVPEGKRVAAWKSALKLAGDKAVTAKVVRQAASAFKPRKAEKVVKRSTAPEVNLKPAFKLIDDIEKLADDNKPLLAKVTALRECLQRIGGK